MLLNMFKTFNIRIYFVRIKNVRTLFCKCIDMTCVQNVLLLHITYLYGWLLSVHVLTVSVPPFNLYR